MTSLTEEQKREAKAIMGGRRILYTSFEGPKLRVQSGTAGQAGVSQSLKMKTIVVKKDALVPFFGRKDYLSNFYTAPFSINGHTYSTVEHYYEGCKIFSLVGAEWARGLREITDPGTAKSQSKRMVAHLPKAVLEKWRRTDGILVAKVAVMEKYRQNPQLKELLLKTGDSFLAQCNKYDNLWAVGMDDEELRLWWNANDGKTIEVPVDLNPQTQEKFPTIGKGKNLLGHLSMIVREQFKRELMLSVELTQMALGSISTEVKDAQVNPTEDDKPSDEVQVAVDREAEQQ